MIVRLLEWFIHGCWHNYQHVRDVNYTDTSYGMNLPCIEQLFRCSKCQRLKRIDITGVIAND